MLSTLKNLYKSNKGTLLYAGVAITSILAIKKLLFADKKSLGLKDFDEEPKSEYFSKLFMANNEGIWLRRYEWTIHNPKGIIFLVHGYGEHLGRYDHIARFLNEAGYSVYGIDHQGYGLSGGERGYVENFQNYVDDYIQFIVMVQSTKRRLPTFILGHSMGGLITTSIILRHDKRIWPWSGVILSSPAVVHDHSKASPMFVSFAQLVSQLAPRHELSPLAKASDICRDPQIIEMYEKDPLVYHGGLKCRTGVGMLQQIEHISNRGSEILEPFLLAQGANDVLVSVSGNEEFYNTIASKDKEFRLLDGLCHEILNEPEWQGVLSDIIEWIDHRCDEKRRNALIIVDVQNDFCTGGSLEVKNSESVVSMCNQLKVNSNNFDKIILTQDWHPANHMSFFENNKENPQAKIFNELEMKDGSRQMMWPVHCVQGSQGAQFHDNLKLTDTDIIVKKGTDPTIDSYSGFYDNGHKKQTDLLKVLQQHQITHCYVVGLAYDYCVGFTALDAVNAGFTTYIITDATAGVAEASTKKMVTRLVQNGVQLITNNELKKTF